MQFDKIVSKRRDRIVYKNGEDCIKVFDKKYSKVIVLSEALNQSRVEATGLNIPHIKEVREFEGNWGIVSDFMPSSVEHLYAVEAGGIHLLFKDISEDCMLCGSALEYPYFFSVDFYYHGFIRYSVAGFSSAPASS